MVKIRPQIFQRLKAERSNEGGRPVSFARWVLRAHIKIRTGVEADVFKFEIGLGPGTLQPRVDFAIRLSTLSLQTNFLQARA